jgi:hypothetical protein
MSSYWPSPFLVAHTIAKAWATFSHAYLGLISVQSPPTVHCDPTVEHVDRKSKTPIHSCSSRTLATSHFTRPKTRERERERVCVRRCTGGAAREPLCRCLCSSEIERTAIEWPCGRSLSGPRPSPVTDDMKNLMSDSEPAMAVPEELLEARLRVTPSNR